MNRSEVGYAVILIFFKTVYGRQLRNNAELTQPRARTNRYAESPIPYYVKLINSDLP